MTFGENVKKCREQAGYTQQELASLSGISRPMVAHIECGRKMPSLTTAFKLAEALRVEVTMLNR